MKIKEGGGMGIQKLTKEQAVIISGFTGILCGEFSDFHADVEKRLGRGVQTFEFGLKEFATEVKKLYEADFIEMGTVDKEQAKSQAVPDTYTPIVLALEDVQSKIAQASFLTMDADNENEVYAVDANELHEYIAELIEAQEPQITELKVEWASDCFKCGHHEAIIYSTAAEASTKGWFHDGDEVKCIGCGNTGEMDARGEDSDICWNEDEAND